MATAKRNIETITVQKLVDVTETVDKGIILNLSNSEAEILRTILGKFQDYGLQHSIFTALVDAGVTNVNYRVDFTNQPPRVMKR